MSKKKANRWKDIKYRLIEVLLERKCQTPEVQKTDEVITDIQTCLRRKQIDERILNKAYWSSPRKKIPDTRSPVTDIL